MRVRGRHGEKPRQPRATGLAGHPLAGRIRTRRERRGRGDGIHPGRRGASEFGSVKTPRPAARGRAKSIRLRLGFALAVALVPVLVLSAIQSALSFQREADEQKTELLAAAERSAAGAKARISASEILLDTLAPGSIGFQCAQRLSEIRSRVPGYANLIRFDANGRLECAAASAPADPQRNRAAWFLALAKGKPLVVTSGAGVPYANEPALLAGVRAEDRQGHFAGALAAIIALASLRPEMSDTIPATVVGGRAHRRVGELSVDYSGRGFSSKCSRAVAHRHGALVPVVRSRWRRRAQRSSPPPRWSGKMSSSSSPPHRPG